MIAKHDLLTLTEWTTSGFNSLAHRGMLPFRPGPSAKHGQYTEEQAVRLCFLKAFTLAGMSQGNAANALRTGFNSIQSYLARRPQPGRADVLLGAVSDGVVGVEDEDWRLAVSLWSGSKTLTQVSDGSQTSRLEKAPGVAVFINASQVMASMQSRAYLRGRAGSDLAEWVALFRAPAK